MIRTTPARRPHHIALKLIALGLALSLLAIIAPPASVYAQSGDGDEDEPFPRTVIDAAGRRVTIPVRPHRVVLAGELPLLTALLPPSALTALDLPPDPDAIPWDDTDLLVMPEIYAAAYPDLLTAADASGTPVYLTRPLASLNDYRILTRSLGRATGDDHRATAWIARLDTRLDAVAARLGDTPPIGVLVLTPEGYTFGKNTLLTAIITAAGGTNLAAAAGYDDFRQIDDRAIRALAPDVILLTPAWDDAALAAFRANPALNDLPAREHDLIVRLSFSPTAPPDPAAAITALAVGLHPHRMLFAR